MDEVADDTNGYEDHLVFVNTVKCYSINLIYPSIKKNHSVDRQNLKFVLLL